MALSDLQVFTEYAYDSMTEVVTQKVDLFNAATRGGLVLQSKMNQGSYSDRAMWAKISGLVRRRNAFGSGAVSEKNLQHLLDTSVKVASGTPPVRIDPGWMKWIARDPKEAGVVLGRQLAGDSMQDMVNVAAGVFVAAVGQVANVVHNYSATGVGSLAQLNVAASKFGDSSGNILCWLMHSKTLFDIYGAALTNANNLFDFGSVRVVHDGFGRPLIVSDSPALFNATPTPDQYHTCGLTAGAIIVENNGDFTDNVETKNGTENITSTYQSEWTYNVGIQGFRWDKTNGGPSPTDAALFTATNWDRYATSDKDLAGVLMTTQ